MLTFPKRREYSSRTSCSRSVTRGLEARRRGLEGLSVVGLGGVLGISESSMMFCLRELGRVDWIVVGNLGVWWW